MPWIQILCLFYWPMEVTGPQLTQSGYRGKCSTTMCPEEQYCSPFLLPTCQIPFHPLANIMGIQEGDQACLV